MAPLRPPHISNSHTPHPAWQTAVNLPTAGQYWAGKAKAWPALAKVGLWWSEFPTSSISAERAFAAMRLMEGPQRLSMKEDNFKAELAFRVNKPLLESLLEASLSKWA